MKFKNFYIIFFILILISSRFSNATENRIIVKLNNEIITSMDVANEINYLNALNPNIKTLKREELFKIAKNSLIKEKIREIEILKTFKQIKIEEDIYQKFLNTNYLKFGYENIEDFFYQMQKFGINQDKLKSKATIEILWGRLIYQKFYSNIKINEQELRNIVLSEVNRENISYLLYEIVINEKNINAQKELFEEIQKNIKENGFENTALSYSSADTSKIGGKIGWINETSLNPLVKNFVSKLSIGEYTAPIKIPSGFIILNLKDKKKEENKIDLDKEFNLLLNSKINEQLNQFSNLFFEKIKKDITINEK